MNTSNFLHISDQYSGKSRFSLYNFVDVANISHDLLDCMTLLGLKTKDVHFCILSAHAQRGQSVFLLVDELTSSLLLEELPFHCTVLCLIDTPGSNWAAKQKRLKQNKFSNSKNKVNIWTFYAFVKCWIWHRKYEIAFYSLPV